MSVSLHKEKHAIISTLCEDHYISSMAGIADKSPFFIHADEAGLQMVMSTSNVKSILRLPSEDQANRIRQNRLDDEFISVVQTLVLKGWNPESKPKVMALFSIGTESAESRCRR